MLRSLLTFDGVYHHFHHFPIFGPIFFIIFLVDLSSVIPISTEGEHNGAVQLNEMYMNVQAA